MRAALAALMTVCLFAAPATAEESPPHDPSGSWRWSLLFPGLGQFALGEPWRGTGFLVGTLTLPILGFTGTHILLTPDQPSAVLGRQLLDDQALLAAGIGVAIAVAAGLWTWSAVDAYHLDLEKSQPQESSALPDLTTPETVPSPSVP